LVTINLISVYVCLVLILLSDLVLQFCLQDIDECKDEKKYPCTHKCINTFGGFDCICPMGMTGDGKKQGNGCKRDTKLLIAAGK
jgi:hypothetical protein